MHLEAGDSGYTGVTTEPVDVDLRLADASDGTVVHELPVTAPEKGQTGRDAVSLQIFDPDGSLDQDFSYTDLGDRAAGDYYYLRITQIDGEQAWSSPWWVGTSQGS